MNKILAITAILILLTMPINAATTSSLSTNIENIIKDQLTQVFGIMPTPIKNKIIEANTEPGFIRDFALLADDSELAQQALDSIKNNIPFQISETKPTKNNKKPKSGNSESTTTASASTENTIKPQETTTNDQINKNEKNQNNPKELSDDVIPPVDRNKLAFKNTVEGYKKLPKVKCESEAECKTPDSKLGLTCKIAEDKDKITLEKAKELKVSSDLAIKSIFEQKEVINKQFKVTIPENFAPIPDTEIYTRSDGEKIYPKAGDYSRIIWIRGEGVCPSQSKAGEEACCRTCDPIINWYTTNFAPGEYNKCVSTLQDGLLKGYGVKITSCVDTPLGIQTLNKVRAALGYKVDADYKPETPKGT